MYQTWPWYHPSKEKDTLNSLGKITQISLLLPVCLTGLFQQNSAFLWVVLPLKLYFEKIRSIQVFHLSLLRHTVIPFWSHLGASFLHSELLMEGKSTSLTPAQRLLFQLATAPMASPQLQFSFVDYPRGQVLLPSWESWGRRKRETDPDQPVWPRNMLSLSIF